MQCIFSSPYVDLIKVVVVYPVELQPHPVDAPVAEGPDLLSELHRH